MQPSICFKKNTNEVPSYFAFSFPSITQNTHTHVHTRARTHPNTWCLQAQLPDVRERWPLGPEVHAAKSEPSLWI